LIAQDSCWVTFVQSVYGKPYRLATIHALQTTDERRRQTTHRAKNST